MAVRRALVGCLLLLTLLPGFGSPALGQESEGEADAPPAQFPGLPLAQPSYDTLRVADNGETLPYRVWEDWVPELATTPDGGAWAFFGAHARQTDGRSSRRLFASRFDPAAGVWQPARAMPGDLVQFGPAAAVDGQGRVHLLYSELSGDDAKPGSTLLYAWADAAGVWSDPVALAPDPNAGFQMMPALAVDAAGRVHALWRDQRGVSAEARAAFASNADIYEALLVDGAWTPARPVTTRVSEDTNPAWPLVAVDGDRVVAVWSVYVGTTEEDLRTAVGVEWSSRPADGSGGWAPAETLISRSDDEVGGRLIDLAAGADGVVVVYGRYADEVNELFLTRLPAGGSAWSDDVPLSTGDYGYLPSVAVGPDGETVVVYNTARNRNVEIGGVAVPKDGAIPPPVLFTASEDGDQFRPSMALDAEGRVWVVYFHLPTGGSATTEIRALRGAALGE